jgi:hypothetical protein
MKAGSTTNDSTTPLGHRARRMGGTSQGPYVLRLRGPTASSRVVQPRALRPIEWRGWPVDSYLMEKRQHEQWVVRPISPGERVVVCADCGAFISGHIDHENFGRVGPRASQEHAEAMRRLSPTASAHRLFRP